MGMFDRVIINCSCGHNIEVQSKAGDCMLKDYNIDYVPEEIARDLQGEEVCCYYCGKKYILDFGIKYPVFYRGGIAREAGKNNAISNQSKK